MNRRMSLPNKLTTIRIILTIFIIFFLLFPFEQIGIYMPEYIIKFNAPVKIGLEYIISGIIFIVAGFTDFLDGYIARKYKLVTDLGKMLDAIADKVLVNSVLICFAANNIISPFITVIIIFRDTIVDAIKMQAAAKGKVIAAITTGKIKTAAMMIALTLLFFSNLPFEFWGIKVADVILYFGVIMSLISMGEYIFKNRNVFE